MNKEKWGFEKVKDDAVVSSRNIIPWGLNKKSSKEILDDGVSKIKKARGIAEESGIEEAKKEEAVNDTKKRGKSRKDV